MTRHIAIIAGEESGDARASALMQELRLLSPELRFEGMGGPRMAAVSGAVIEDWIAEAAVVGLWDVLKRYPYFRKKFSEVTNRIVTARPDTVIFVDYPGFNLRLAARLRQRLPSSRLVYFISPQVWAWHRSRISKMAKILDLMICIFPFEKELYENSGLPTVFCGHPLVEEIGEMTPLAAREKNLVGLFPGSRWREIERLVPVYVDAARRILLSLPEARFVFAAASDAQAGWIRNQVSGKNLPIAVEVKVARDLMRRASAGVVCSGTASLEAALCGLPYCLVYRVPWLTYAVGRRLIRVSHLGMVNILLGREVVRELIQADCTAFRISDEVMRLLNCDFVREALVRDFSTARAMLGEQGAARRAAQEIFAFSEQPPPKRS